MVSNQATLLMMIFNTKVSLRAQRSNLNVCHCEECSDVAIS